MVKKTIKTLVLILLPLIILGCATIPNIQTQEVKLPVYKKLDIPYRQYPDLPINKITNDTPDYQVALKYAQTVKVLTAELDWYRTILYGNKYKNKSLSDSVNHAQ